MEGDRRGPLVGEVVAGQHRVVTTLSRGAEEVRRAGAGRGEGDVYAATVPARTVVDTLI